MVFLFLQKGLLCVVLPIPLLLLFLLLLIIRQHKTAAHVALGLMAVATVIATVAIVSLLVPAVGLFILGASFTALLAGKIVLGACITVIVLALTALGLYYLHGSQKLSPSQLAELFPNLPRK